MIQGLSARKYALGLESAGHKLKTSGTSESVVSRRFIAITKKKWLATLHRRLDDRHYVALLIDGIVMADHTVVALWGLTK